MFKKNKARDVIFHPEITQPPSTPPWETQTNEIPIPPVTDDFDEMSWRQFFFSYKGRISKKEYTRYALCLVAFLVIIYVCLQSFPILFRLCQVIAFLGVYTMFPTTAKRIHDLGYPGYFCVIMLAPLIIAFFIGIAWLFYVAAIPTMFLGGIGCCFMEGTPGRNNTEIRLVIAGYTKFGNNNKGLFPHN